MRLIILITISLLTGRFSQNLIDYYNPVHRIYDSLSGEIEFRSLYDLTRFIDKSIEYHGKQHIEYKIITIDSSKYKLSWIPRIPD